MFIVTRTEPHQELFRAVRLEQRIEPAQELAEGGPGPVAVRTGTSIGPGHPANSEPVEFVNLDTGGRFTCTLGVGGRRVAWPDGREHDELGRHRVVYPRRLHVQRRPRAAADYEYILEPLEAVFAAAVATGNPVRWS